MSLAVRLPQGRNNEKLSILCSTAIDLVFFLTWLERQETHRTAVVIAHPGINEDDSARFVRPHQTGPNSWGPTRLSPFTYLGENEELQSLFEIVMHQESVSSTPHQGPPKPEKRILAWKRISLVGVLQSGKSVVLPALPEQDSPERRIKSALSISVGFNLCLSKILFRTQTKVYHDICNLFEHRHSFCHSFWHLNLHRIMK